MSVVPMTFANVVAGVDGSEGGRRAAAVAAGLAPDALTLVAAYPVDLVRSRASNAGYEELLREDALADLEAARPATAATTHVDLVAAPDASPARALRREAAVRGADLLVVGPARHGALGRVVLGDVGRALLRDAPCPVLVVPAGAEAARPSRIAVAYDGSAAARAALTIAADLASTLPAAVTVYVVREDPPALVAGAAGAGMFLGELIDATRAAADTQLRDALAGLPAGASGSVLHGDPDLQLERVAAGHDLMIVGTRGRGALRRTALGSTSDWLVHHAPCAVLVVPQPSAAAEAQDAEPVAAGREA